MSRCEKKISHYVGVRLNVSIKKQKNLLRFEREGILQPTLAKKLTHCHLLFRAIVNSELPFDVSSATVVVVVVVFDHDVMFLLPTPPAAI